MGGFFGAFGDSNIVSNSLPVRSKVTGEFGSEFPPICVYTNWPELKLSEM